MRLWTMTALCTITLLMGGCPTETNTAPSNTFTAGTGNDFGVATSADGDTFDIKSAGQGRIRVVSNDGAGEVIFEIDTEGRLVSVAGPSGSTVDLTYNADGSIDVVGLIAFQGNTEPFTGTIPADAIPAGILPTGKGLTLQDNDPFTVCVAINAFCSLYDVLVEEIIALIALEVIGAPVYPTGIAFVDNGIRDEAITRVPILVQIQQFCTLWPILDIEPCRG